MRLPVSIRAKLGQGALEKSSVRNSDLYLVGLDLSPHDRVQKNFM